jgi:PPOX class probable F420-dependent enzyme
VDDDARAFLDRQRVAHLATAGADGTPHVVPICFVLLGDRLYVAIDEKPKRGQPGQLQRVRNILANPRVAIVADVYSEDWSQLGFVLVRGRARMLSDGEEHQSAVSALRSKYAQYAVMALDDRPMIAVDVERLTRWGMISAHEEEQVGQG